MTIEGLRADLELCDRNAKLALADKDADWKRRIYGVLDNPLAAVLRDFLAVKQGRGEPQDIENLGISLDGLRRRIESLHRLKLGEK